MLPSMTNFSIRLDDRTLARLEAQRVRLSGQGIPVQRSEVLRLAVERGLEVLESAATRRRR